MATGKLSSDPYERLSAQDREILRCLGKGMDLAAIARQIGLSTEILTDRCDDVCKKLGLLSRKQLRGWALRRVAVAGQAAVSTSYAGQLLLPFGSGKGAD